MACRKCGSEWVTLKGRDCNSCPHCNKVQRSLERKRGRWIDKQEVVPCRHCGVLFSRKILVGIQPKQAYCSHACRCAGKVQWRKQWLLAYTQGVRKQNQTSKHAPRPTCKECGRQFNKQAGSNVSNIYCSKSCFFAARNSGRHSWDKTNIKKANWHKGGWYASAPSVRLMRRISRAHLLVLRVSGGLERQAGKELNRPMCEQCGQACNDGASRFCSYECNRAWRGTRCCKVCQAAVPGCSANGPAYCDECRTEAKRKYRKKYKRELGSHRKKVRKGGGFWNSSVRRSVVLARDRYRCYLCRKKCKKTFEYNDPLSATVDMVVPASKGGDWDYYNLRCACRQCNSRKSDRLMGQLTLRMGT